MNVAGVREALRLLEKAETFALKQAATAESRDEARVLYAAALKTSVDAALSELRYAFASTQLEKFGALMHGGRFTPAVAAEMVRVRDSESRNDPEAA